MRSVRYAAARNTGRTCDDCRLGIREGTVPGVEMIEGLVEAGSRLLQLAIAFLLALPIAWDREQKERSAGLRTFTLVAVSTCGFLMAARSSLGPSVDAESRVWQGLLTGIGFIGSGAILKTDGTVHGTATAASIWNTAAVGAAVAYGKYDIAVVLSLANRARGGWRGGAPADRGDAALAVAHPRQTHVRGNGWFQRGAERTRRDRAAVRQID